MAEKKIIISFNRPPRGTVFYSEGLRAAAGLTAGIDEHKVDIVFLGDGVLCALKGVDRSDSARFLAALAQRGSKLYCEEESLKARMLSRDDLAEDVTLIPRSEVLQLYREADLSIDF